MRRPARDPDPLRAVARVALCSALALCMSSCKPADEGSTEPSVGTNSNWLRACVADAECSGEPVCECGACTKPCATDGDCDGLPDARCIREASPSASQSCGGAAGDPPSTDASTSASGRPSLCLPHCEPGSCREGQACVAGGCVLSTLPDVAFCAEVADRPLAERTREEELLALIAALRAAGGASCGSAAPSAPAPALRLDARLTCAARVLAADIARTRMLSVIDSQAGTTETRVRSAGYAPSLWADAFTLDVESAAAARDLMLSDPGSCAALTGSRFTEVGIGSATDALVVTLAAP
jgi:hypothetical protein